MKSLHQATFVLIVIMALVPLARAQLQSSGMTDDNSENATSIIRENEKNSDTNTLRYREAFVLGLVEGITEFLPISSTGHLIITNQLLGLNGEQPINNQAGTVLLQRPPSENFPEGEPFTLKSAVDAYTVIIQAGAIAAVLIIYWSKICTIVQGLFGKSREGLYLGRNLLIAFIPAAIIGLALENWIDRYLFNHWPVIIALVAGAILMLCVEYWRNKHYPNYDGGPDLHELTPGNALLIGLMQCVAMWPGTSRSMMTIVGGYCVGLSPRRAAEFSFLLGLPTLTLAALYKGVKNGPLLFEAFGWAPVLFGCIVAALSAAIAVKWLVNYLTKHGLSLFAYYRIGLALLFIILVS